MKKWEAAKDKKSFTISYHGGEIWCEHLDSLGEKYGLLEQKWEQDLPQIARPSTSGYLVIILNETKVKEETILLILNGLLSLKKPLCKVAFTGLESRMKRYLKSQDLPFPAICMDDLQKAKEWLIK